MLRRLIFPALLALCYQQTLASEALSRAAAEYPARPIRVIVPSSPGGGIDTLARIIGPRMTETWGKAVIADNRPGAGGILGYEIVVKAPPEGYTVLIVAGG